MRAHNPGANLKLTFHLERTHDRKRSRRPHASLDGITPDQAYFTPLPLRLAA